MNVLTSLKELASLMSLKWIEPSILGFKQTKNISEDKRK